MAEAAEGRPSWGQTTGSLGFRNREVEEEVYVRGKATQHNATQCSNYRRRRVGISRGILNRPSGFVVTSCAVKERKRSAVYVLEVCRKPREGRGVFLRSNIDGKPRPPISTWAGEFQWAGGFEVIMSRSACVYQNLDELTDHISRNLPR